MPDSYLEVVDEAGKVVGRELRSTIHRLGLLHREIHVWFMTDDGMIVLQRRSSSKDTYPLLLCATVGGHVEEGSSFLSTALIEVREETGIALGEADLVRLGTVRATDIDPVRGTINNALREVYRHSFQGDVEDLEIEAEDGGGFEMAPLEDILRRQGQWPQEMVPALLETPYGHIWEALSRRLGKDVVA